MCSAASGGKEDGAALAGRATIALVVVVEQQHSRDHLSRPPVCVWNLLKPGARAFVVRERRVIMIHIGRRSLRGESCGSRSLAQFREKPLLDSVDRVQCTQLLLLDHPDPTNMTTVRLLVVSESTSTASTVGCHCELAQIGTLGVTEGEHDGE